MGEASSSNANVSFKLVIEMEPHRTRGEAILGRRGVKCDPKLRDPMKRLVIVKDGKRVAVQNPGIWQDFIRSAIPMDIPSSSSTVEKIQTIAADDHSEIRLKSPLEAALGIRYINRFASDILYIKQGERMGLVEISDP
jgi:DNA sulfur modification protein DndD